MVLAKVGGFSGHQRGAGVPPHILGSAVFSRRVLGLDDVDPAGPGLCDFARTGQKAYGAESVRAREDRPGRGGDRAADVLVLPRAARHGGARQSSRHRQPNLVLPTVMLHELPVLVGALALAAVFSAEVSTCDAILFMLVHVARRRISISDSSIPPATPDQVLRVARIAALAGGVLGMILAVQLVDDRRRVAHLLFAARGVAVRSGVGRVAVCRAPARGKRWRRSSAASARCSPFIWDRSQRLGDPSLWGLIGSAVGFFIATVDCCPVTVVRR